MKSPPPHLRAALGECVSCLFGFTIFAITQFIYLFIYQCLSLHMRATADGPAHCSTAVCPTLLHSQRIDIDICTMYCICICIFICSLCIHIKHIIRRFQMDYNNMVD